MMVTKLPLNKEIGVKTVVSGVMTNGSKVELLIVPIDRRLVVANKLFDRRIETASESL